MTSGKVVTTIGYERRYNSALNFTDEGEFTEFMLRDQPTRPANMKNIVAINQGRSAYGWELPSVPAVSIDEAVRQIATGVTVVDTRISRTFCEGHIAGSINLQAITPGFEQNAGWVLPPEGEFVLAVDSPEQAQRAVAKLAFVGLEQRVGGFIEMPAWIESGRPVESVRQIGVDELFATLGSETYRILDVRESGEWSAGRIEPATHFNFKRIPEHLDRLGIDPDTPLAVVCGSGMRSSTACSLLRQANFSRLHNVTGGMGAWVSAGYPTVV